MGSSWAWAPGITGATTTAGAVVASSPQVGADTSDAEGRATTADAVTQVGPAADTTAERAPVAADFTAADDPAAVVDVPEAADDPAVVVADVLEAVVDMAAATVADTANQ
jgi:hypothetical protein